MPQVISANRLVDGIVVFLDRDGQWVEKLNAAATFADKTSLETAVASAQKDVAKNIVVDIFPFDVTVSGATISAIALRDKIRTNGPTVHLDHGKQAAAG